MMKTLGFLLAALALGMGTAQADPRHRSHVDFGFYMGGPGPWFYGPPPVYYPPYYYPPRVVVVPQEAPTVYVEQAPQAAAPAPAPAQQPAYWYYCRSAKAYYPYVKNCPEGWQAVQPQPPAP